MNIAKLGSLRSKLTNATIKGVNTPFAVRHF